MDGYKAAARVAGMVAAASITDSLTHAVVQGATGIEGALTNAEIEQAIQSGALVFSMSAQKQVHIESGITTFVTPTADMDAGWKKIRRMKTRDNLIERIVAAWDPLIGKINNDGRQGNIDSGSAGDYQPNGWRRSSDRRYLHRG